MKKRICVLMMAALLCTSVLAGCGSNTAGNQPSDVPGASEAVTPDEGTSGEEQTIGNELKKMFLDEATAAQDLDALAASLIQAPELADQNMVSMAVEPGYLNGFEGEINGFTSGVVFSPMIGSIPFVGYVFESDDPEALKAELEAKGQLNWNICTTADEMVSAVAGSRVFFVMAPYSFE